MSRVKSLEFERAEQIAQLYLQSIKQVDLLPSFDDDLDFLLFPKETHQKQIGIEVKATKLSPIGIKNKYLNLRRRYSNERIPIMILYINVDSENGFFEIINKKQSTEIIELKIDLLSRETHKIFQTMPGNKLWFQG